MLFATPSFNVNVVVKAWHFSKTISNFFIQNIREDLNNPKESP